jgi:hypothetical protein
MDNNKNIQIEKVFPNWVWAVYIVLFTFSIPWYFPEVLAMKLVFGLPFWLVCSILMIFLMALFTVFIIYKFWKSK